MPCGKITMKKTGGIRQTIFTKNGKLVSMRCQRSPLKLSQIKRIRAKKYPKSKNLVWEVDRLLK